MRITDQDRLLADLTKIHAASLAAQAQKQAGIGNEDELLGVSGSLKQMMTDITKD